MPHPIDPTVDFAFKILLGSEENRDLLVHFLNTVVALDPPVVEIALLNPFNPAQYSGDDFTIVDLKARDATGRVFQVELQLQLHDGLPARMLYTWSSIYAAQLGEGMDYIKLRPVYSIWILNRRLIKDSKAWHHRFQLLDARHTTPLCDHLEVHTIELPKWAAPTGPLSPSDQWIRFLRDAGKWDRLPPELDLREMEQAMAVLSRISEKEEDYWRYLSRQDAMRVKLTIERQAERDRLALEAARQEAEEAQRTIEEAQRTIEEAQRAADVAQKSMSAAQQLAAKEVEARLAAERELEALRARLRALGADPDVR